MRPVQFLIGGLVVLLLMLQWSIWFGAPDAFDALALRAEVETQTIDNAGRRERNAALGAEVRDLKQGTDAVEERARSDLGMVKAGETFYQVVAPATPTAQPPAAAPATTAAPQETSAGDPPERARDPAPDRRT